MRQTTSLGGVVLASVFLIGASAQPGGQFTGLNQSAIATAETSRRVHGVGDVWVKIGNDGTFCAPGSGSVGDVWLLLHGSDPAFEFPASSKHRHSYIGGLWITGVSGDDTLASFAAGPASEDRTDFNPITALSIRFDTVRSHQSFRCAYTDTSFRRTGANRPLGVEVRQVSHAFASAPYNRFVILEYLIRNISRQVIRKPAVGFFDDADVFDEIAQGLPESGASDDLAGYIASHNLGYVIDNNGDPVGDSLWSRNSTVTAIGIAPIYFDPAPVDSSFNWWATNFSNIDWGPEKAPGAFAYQSTPQTPAQMHEIMTNAEHDYDQLWAAVDKRSEGWRAPLSPTHGPNLANGLDTRILLSYSFRDLVPDDSIRLVIALVAGDSVHRAPEDFVRHFDATRPEDFYAHLDFTDLTSNVDRARYAWTHNYDLYGAAPARLTLTSLADDAIRCVWTPAPFFHVTGYRLLRRVQGVLDWDTVASVSNHTVEVTNHGISAGVNYEYAVASVDWGGQVGPPSRCATITAAKPPEIPTIKSATTPDAVAITGEFAAAPSGFAEYTQLNVYRRTLPQYPFVLHQQLPIQSYGQSVSTDGEWMSRQTAKPSRNDPYRFTPLPPDDPFGWHSISFVDDSVTCGVTYEYSLSLTNRLGVEGERSASRFALPMQLDRRGLVVFYTSNSQEMLINRDSVFAFYDLWAERLGFDTANVVSPPIWEDRYPNMSQLQHYQCIVLVQEDRSSGQPFDPLASWLSSYSRAGGKCVIVSRNQGISSTCQNCEGGPSSPQSWPRELFGDFTVWHELFTSKQIHNRLQWTRVAFQRALPRQARYPVLEGDSAAGWDFSVLRMLIGYSDTLYGAGFVPAVGAMDSFGPDVEILYEYSSAYPELAFHGKPIAVKRITDSTAAILFNFPLSLMKHEQAWQALTQAVADLGIDTVNYFIPPTSTTRSMIEWLYGRSTVGPDPKWDFNRDGVVDIRDVVQELDQ